MPKKRFAHAFPLAAVLLALIVTVPLTGQALFRSQDDYGVRFEDGVQDIYRKAQEDQASLALRRRRYHTAMRRYRDLQNAGSEDLVRPDINDPSTVARYLEGSGNTPADTIHAAAEEEESGSGSGPELTITEVSREDRQLLRRYERAGTCPVSLQNYIPGFYELCLSLVGRRLHVEPRIGILNDLVRIRSSRNILPNTLNVRLEMIRQARDSATRRTDIVQPSRRRTAAPEQP